MIGSIIQYQHEWAHFGNDIVNLNYSNYASIEGNDLQLVKVFR